jgi:hypothetical protein
MARHGILALVLLLGFGLGLAPAAEPAAVLGWGDQGDGTYRNPVLKAGYRLDMHPKYDEMNHGGRSSADASLTPRTTIDAR